MMVKNEAENLTRCLESVQNILKNLDSELIIVDTGSTDHTVEIAKKYTDRVYFHQWENDFSAMRNTTISYAKGDWLFILDADEVIADDSGIIEFFKLDKKRQAFNALCIPLRNFNLKYDESTFTDINAVRFFKNDGEFHYKSIIHELPVFKEPVGSLTGIIYHYGYVNDDPILMAKKYERTVALLNKALLEEPKNIYMRYQLSVSYGMYGDWEGSKSEALRAYEDLQKVLPKERNEYFYLYGQLMLLHKYFKENEETIKIGKEALAVRNKDIDAYFYIADAYICMDKREDAIPYLIKYLDLIKQYENRQFFINLDVKLETLRYKTKEFSNLLYILHEDGQYAEVLRLFKVYKTFINSDEFSKNAIETTIKSAIQNKTYMNIYELYSIDIIELKTHIRLVLEKQLGHREQSERIKIYETLRGIKDPYGQISDLRHQLESDQADLEPREKMNVRIEGLEPTYGDVVFNYYMKVKDENAFLNWVRQNAFKIDLEIIDKLMHMVDSFESWAKEYISRGVPSHLGELTFRHNIEKYMLLQLQYQNRTEMTLNIFIQFIETRKQILTMLYRSDFIENEKNWVGMELEEDRLCLYVDRALNGSVLQAASYFKKALPMAGDLVSYVHSAVLAKEAEMLKQQSTKA